MAGELEDLFAGWTVEITVTGGADEVPAAARSHRGADLLAVVGGDGTVGEVAGALVDEETPPVFVVPAGRGNSAYRHCYGDDDWHDVARALARGLSQRPLDLGAVRSDPPVARDHFVLGFTAGLFRRALDAADSMRFLPGPLAYLLGTARAAVSDPPLDVAVTVDDRERFDGEARLVAVGGGRYRGNAFELFPGSRPGDGSLHSLVVEPTRAREWVTIARLARDGRHVDHPAVHYWQGDSVGIRSQTPLPVEIDGTALSSVSDAELTVVPGALSLAVPAE